MYPQDNEEIVSNLSTSGSAAFLDIYLRLIFVGFKLSTYARIASFAFGSFYTQNKSAFTFSMVDEGVISLTFPGGV